MARAMATGSRAAASAVFIRIPSTPCSMVRQASDAVPTPALTTTGTLSRRLMVRTPNGLRRPSPLPIGEASGMTAAQPGHQVLVGVGEVLEALRDQCARGDEQALNIREEGLLVADHLEVDELVEPRLAGEARVADGILGGVASRGVREQEVPLCVEVIEDALFLRAVQVHASDRHGDDLGAGRVDRPGHGLVVPVLPRAHHEARVERAPADRERNVQHQPPPTKCTSSIASPGATVTAPRVGRRTMVRLCSTTTARGSSASDSSSSSSVAPRATARGSPLTVTSTVSFIRSAPSASVAPRPRDRPHATAP